MVGANHCEAAVYKCRFALYWLSILQPRCISLQKLCKKMFWLSLLLVLLMKFIYNVFQGRLPFSINLLNSIDKDGVLLLIQSDTLGLYICKDWTLWPWASFPTSMILWCYTILFSICTWLTFTIWFSELKDNIQVSWKYSASPFLLYYVFLIFSFNNFNNGLLKVFILDRLLPERSKQ